MKSKKYKFIFAGLLLWIIASSFLSKEVIDVLFSIISISFLILIIYDLFKNNLMFSPPSLFEFVIDVIALITIVSGVFVEINYSSIFLYLFIFCALVFIFTKPKISDS